MKEKKTKMHMKEQEAEKRIKLYLHHSIKKSSILKIPCFNLEYKRGTNQKVELEPVAQEIHIPSQRRAKKNQ